jgi:methylmalonyl-CoA/ethylmalonyl-CoA epimerase
MSIRGLPAFIPESSSQEERRTMESLGITRLDHVAMAVWSVEEYLPFLTELFGMKVVDRWRSEEEEYAGVTLDLPGGGIQWEIVEPISDDSFLARFLKERGPGLHHVTFEVEDVERAAATLRGRGIEPFGGVRNRSTWRELFIHPGDSGGLLVQLFDGHWPASPDSGG